MNSRYRLHSTLITLMNLGNRCFILGIKSLKLFSVLPTAEKSGIFFFKLAYIVKQSFYYLTNGPGLVLRSSEVIKISWTLWAVLEVIFGQLLRRFFLAVFGIVFWQVIWKIVLESFMDDSLWRFF